MNAETAEQTDWVGIRVRLADDCCDFGMMFTTKNEPGQDLTLQSPWIYDSLTR